MGLKTPLAFLALVALGAWIALDDALRHRSGWSLAPIAAALAMLAVALASDINLGVRHVLPLYVPLAVAAGAAAVRLAAGRRGRILVAGLLLWMGISTVPAHPDYLAYFNEAAGSHPEDLLVESDLDWGQDLHRLGRWARETGARPLSLAYFGTADPARFGLEAARPLAPGERPDGWAAVSRTRLKTEPGYAWLDARRPDAMAGRSIEIFRLDGAARGEVRRGPDGCRGEVRSEILGMRGQVGRDAFGVRLHARLPPLPAGRADFAVLLEELEGIHHAHHLVHVPPEGEVVDELVLDDPLAVDEERSPERHSGLRVLDAVAAADLVADVGHDGEAHLADAAALDRGLPPREMGVLGVDGDADHLHPPLLELVEAMVVGHDLGGAHEREIERPEEEHDVLPFQRLEVEFLDGSVRIDRRGLEIRGALGDEDAHGCDAPFRKR
jgi:hypothetical protein